MILFLLIIPVIFILIKLIIFLIVKKYGKFSYDGFSAAGFAYNPEEDLFYSTKNAWQKNFGYTHMYDVLAPIGRMIIDTEPVRFYYNHKNWLLTFWKGQYGIVTGAEVGIYCTSEQKVNKRTVYLPVSDNEMLDIYLILYKKGEMIAKIKARHWWLAVFKLGMFSKPKELSMDVNIVFPNKEMLEAFLKSFKKLKHKKKDYKVIGNIFCFRYTKPRTRKVWTRTWLTDGIRQYFNRKNVLLYNKYLGSYIDDNKKDDYRTMNSKKLIRVNDFIPKLLKNNEDLSNESKIIVKRLASKKLDNIVFLNANVTSGLEVTHNE